MTDFVREQGDRQGGTSTRAGHTPGVVNVKASAEAPPAGGYTNVQIDTALALKAPIAQAFETLVDGSTITWDVTGKRDPRGEVTIAGNRTLAFTGLVDGQSGVLVVIQGAGGSRTLTLPANSYVRDSGAGAITLSTAVGAIDMLSFIKKSDGKILWSFGVGYTGA